jgi:cytochrome P450
MDFHISADPQLCREVLVGSSDEFSKTSLEHRVLAPVMEDGLVILEGERWKERRRASAACFGARAIEELTATLQQSASQRVDGWKATVELEHECRCIIMESMTRFFLNGLSTGELPRGTDDFSRSYSRVEKGLESRVFDRLFLKERLRAIFTPDDGFFRSLRRVTEAIDSRVENPGLPTMENSALHALLEKMGDRRSVSREIRTMLAAGATTAHLLSWIGHLLIAHPEVQESLREEIFAKVGAEGELSLPRVEGLSYLTGVVQEGLRLYPPAPYLLRKRAARAKGERSAVFLFSLWAMHRDPRLWGDPDAFRPERWSDKDAIPAEAYIPFGLGPRVCIGKRFAMTEARVILIEILRRHRLTQAGPLESPTPVFTVLTRPRRGVKVSVAAPGPT